jgi:hypothetical protein
MAKIGVSSRGGHRIADGRIADFGTPHSGRGHGRRHRNQFRYLLPHGLQPTSSL